MIIRFLLAATSSALLLMGIPVQADWYPLTVDRWDPPFNVNRERIEDTYIPLEAAQQRWNICVLIPHVKDDWWLGANFGLVAAAERLGVNLHIYSAGGYDNLEEQRAQFRECLQKPEGELDGIILSALDATALNGDIRLARESGIPVLDMINVVNSPDINARIAVDYYDLGIAAGEYLKKLIGDSTEEVGVAWFPGPVGPVWPLAADAGLRHAIAGTRIRIRAMKQGDTGRKIQADLIEEVIAEQGAGITDQVDFIVGTGVAAGAAMSVLRKHKLDEHIRILSYYYGKAVHKGVKRGTIMAALTDVPVLQARISVDTMVRIIENKPHLKHAAPRVMVVDRSNIQQWDSSTTLPPRGFRPIFSVKE